MPQFQVVMSGGKAVPLSPGQKFRLASHTAVDPFYIGYAFVIGGGYSELVGSHPGYGWGPAGYFKRVGASYALIISGGADDRQCPAAGHSAPGSAILSPGHRLLRQAISALRCALDRNLQGRRNGHTTYRRTVSNVASATLSRAASPTCTTRRTSAASASHSRTASR